MKPPPSEWRAWLYGLAWMGGGIVWTVIAIWQTRTFIYGPWLASTQPQRLGILGFAHYMSLSIPLVVMIGLVMRNAIRSIKFSASRDGVSGDLNASDAADAVAHAATDKAEEIKENAP